MLVTNLYYDTMQKAQVSASRPRAFSFSLHSLHFVGSSFCSFPIFLTSFLHFPWLPFFHPADCLFLSCWLPFFIFPGCLSLSYWRPLPYPTSFPFFILLDDLTSRQVRFLSLFYFFRFYETGAATSASKSEGYTSAYRYRTYRHRCLRHADSAAHTALIQPRIGNLSRPNPCVGKLSHHDWVFVTVGLGNCHTCFSCLGFCHVS